MNETPIACNLQAFSPEEHERYDVVTQRLSAACLGVEDLTDGCAFRYPEGRGALLDIAEFIALESRCCPFFRFQMTAPSGGGAIRLEITGGEGVKPFLKDALKIGA